MNLTYIGIILVLLCLVGSILYRMKASQCASDRYQFYIHRLYNELNDEDYKWLHYNFVGIIIMWIAIIILFIILILQ